jgi:hypothetical protein
MAKIRLEPNPTFDWPVSIPRPGLEPVSVRFTFRHRSRTDVLAWVDSIGKDQKVDIDQVMDVAVGWELDDPFTRENVELLCENYGGASRAILETYLRELRGAREKN